MAAGTFFDMAIQQQILNSKQYWSEILVPDYDDSRLAPANLRLAFHAAIALFHMHDWIRTEYDSYVAANFSFLDNKGKAKPVSNSSEFANSLEQTNHNFGLIRGVANAAKHLALNHVSPIANAPSHAANVQIQTTGFGMGGFGTGPF